MASITLERITHFFPAEAVKERATRARNEHLTRTPFAEVTRPDQVATSALELLPDHYVKKPVVIAWPRKFPVEFAPNLSSQNPHWLNVQAIEEMMQIIKDNLQLSNTAFYVYDQPFLHLNTHTFEALPENLDDITPDYNRQDHLLPQTLDALKFDMAAQPPQEVGSVALENGCWGWAELAWPASGQAQELRDQLVELINTYIRRICTDLYTQVELGDPELPVFLVADNAFSKSVVVTATLKYFTNGKDKTAQIVVNVQHRSTGRGPLGVASEPLLPGLVISTDPLLTQEAGQVFERADHFAINPFLLDKGTVYTVIPKGKQQIEWHQIRGAKQHYFVNEPNLPTIAVVSRRERRQLAKQARIDALKQSQQPAVAETKPVAEVLSETAVNELAQSIPLQQITLTAEDFSAKKDSGRYFIQKINPAFEQLSKLFSLVHAKIAPLATSPAQAINLTFESIYNWEAITQATDAAYLEKYWRIKLVAEGVTLTQKQIAQIAGHLNTHSTLLYHDKGVWPLYQAAAQTELTTSLKAGFESEQQGELSTELMFRNQEDVQVLDAEAFYLLRLLQKWLPVGERSLTRQEVDQALAKATHAYIIGNLPSWAPDQALRPVVAAHLDRTSELITVHEMISEAKDQVRIREGEARDLLRELLNKLTSAYRPSYEERQKIDEVIKVFRDASGSEKLLKCLQTILDTFDLLNQAVSEARSSYGWSTGKYELSRPALELMITSLKNEAVPLPELTEDVVKLALKHGISLEKLTAVWEANFDKKTGQPLVKINHAEVVQLQLEIRQAVQQYLQKAQANELDLIWKKALSGLGVSSNDIEKIWPKLKSNQADFVEAMTNILKERIDGDSENPVAPTWIETLNSGLGELGIAHTIIWFPPEQKPEIVTKENKLPLMITSITDYEPKVLKVVHEDSSPKAHKAEPATTENPFLVVGNSKILKGDYKLKLERFGANHTVIFAVERLTTSEAVAYFRLINELLAAGYSAQRVKGLSPGIELSDPDELEEFVKKHLRKSTSTHAKQEPTVTTWTNETASLLVSAFGYSSEDIQTINMAFSPKHMVEFLNLTQQLHRAGFTAANLRAAHVTFRNWASFVEVATELLATKESKPTKKATQVFPVVEEAREYTRAERVRLLDTFGMSMDSRALIATYGENINNFFALLEDLVELGYDANDFLARKINFTSYAAFERVAKNLLP